MIGQALMHTQATRAGDNTHSTQATTRAGDNTHSTHTGDTYVCVVGTVFLPASRRLRRLTMADPSEGIPSVLSDIIDLDEGVTVDSLP